MTTFEIPGEPVAKGRPRFNKKSGATYTPKQTASFENRVALFAREAGVPLLDGPVFANITFWFEWPKSMWRKRNPRGEEWMDTGKDVDNMAKGVLDALNGIAYHDDKQVCALTVSKRRAAQGKPAKTCVSITSMVPVGRIGNTEQ